MKIILFIAFLLNVQSIFATVGGTLFPLDTINVSLDHKHLIITLRERYFEVEAYLVLYNHESEFIQPRLGLEFSQNSSSGWGMGRSNVRQNPQDYVFLTVNNEIQTFEHQRRFEGEEANTVGFQTLVYKPWLNPGRNTVYYKFLVPYHGEAPVRFSASYQFHSNRQWKNSSIENFEITIRTEFNTEIVFPIGQRGVINIGVLETTGQSRHFSQSTSDHYILTPNGYLHTQIQNFIPAPGWRIFFEMLIWDWTVGLFNLTERRLQSLSSEELRIMRNTLFAIHGLVFNDNALNEHFNKQPWYFPNPDITSNDIIFNETERFMLERIIAEERRRLQ